MYFKFCKLITENAVILELILNIVYFSQKGPHDQSNVVLCLRIPEKSGNVNWQRMKMKNKLYWCLCRFASVASLSPSRPTSPRTRPSSTGRTRRETRSKEEKDDEGLAANGFQSLLKGIDWF
mgnify:CR=1 FL=1